MKAGTVRVDLNPEQREAVEFGEGPLLVLAGAGSGKTRVLTARVARLIGRCGLPPERILAVTFTNKAAGEMRERIGTLIGRETRGLWIGTFHSIAARLLRREAPHVGRERAFTIYDEDDSIRALKEAMAEVGLDPRRWSPRALRARISSAKNVLVGPGDYSETAYDPLSRAVADAYPAYQRILANRNAYDFDDLLVESVRLLEDVPEVGDRYADQFLHVLVDEYQDTNRAQYRIVRALARRHGNICVVGDDDQSIYGWRGADLRNILDFERDYAGAHVVRLERNYRSTRSILEVANAVISCNVERKPKRLRTERDAGEPILVVRTADERREARWTTRRIRDLAGRYRFGDSAVLYRTNAQSRAFEEALRRAAIPYRIVGGVPFYERREIKDLLSYLRLCVNPSDDQAFRRAIAWPRRGVGEASLRSLSGAASERNGSLLETAATAADLPGILAAAGRSLVQFAERIGVLATLQRAAGPREVLEECVQSFGLASALEQEEDGADRLENVSELFAAAAVFDRADVDDAADDASDLELYLQSVSLRSDTDDLELEEDAVTLMTLHNAKGLEFPIVFVAGLEEGLFPLFRSTESEGGLEEERRLFYVGVTRAKDLLYLTHADRRWRAGMESRSARSSFLDELPEEWVERRIAGGLAARHGRQTGGTSGTIPTSWSVRIDEVGTGEGRFDWRRGATARSGELIYDFGDSQEPLALASGSRIVHPRFGEGTVLSVNGEGRATKAEIDFDRSGPKKVMVAYAGLRPA